jgi:hypothetical protein
VRIEDHRRLIELITGYQGAAVVTAAWNLGVFAAVGDEPQGADQLAIRLDVDVRSLEALLEALAELGLLRRDGGRFAATAFGATHLARGAELGLVIEKEAVFARAWHDLERVVREGMPVLAPWSERLRTEPERARSFLSALDVLARLTGPDLGSVPSLAPGRLVLDVGGGLGTYARALVAAGSISHRSRSGHARRSPIFRRTSARSWPPTSWPTDFLWTSRWRPPSCRISSTICRPTRVGGCWKRSMTPWVPVAPWW